MAVSKRFWLALPLVPLGYLIFQYITSIVADSYDSVIDACAAHSSSLDYPRLRYVYTGTKVDVFLCMIVVFFREFLADRAGKAYGLALLDLFAVTLAVMSMEGSRKGLSWTILAWVPLFGTLAQLVGVSVVVPALWIPLYEFYRSRLNAAPESGMINPYEAYIPSARAISIVLATLLGAIAPTAIMYFAPERSKFQEDIIAVWQIFPLFPTIIYVVLTPLISRFVTGGKAKTYARYSSLVTQRALMALAVLSAIQHVHMLVYAYHHLSWSDVLDTINIKPATTTTYIAQLQWKGAKFILAELVFCSASMGYWLLLETGIKGLAMYLGLTPLVGPGCALALTCVWREKIMQEDDDAMVKKSK